jgi:hypothetical protein
MFHMINQMAQGQGDAVQLNDDELRLVLTGLGELPIKMSINLFLKLDAILKARHDTRNQPEPDQPESEENNGD